MSVEANCRPRSRLDLNPFRMSGPCRHQSESAENFLTAPPRSIRLSGMKNTSQHGFSLGVDYGTNSVRALIVDLDDGAEVASCASDYPSGEHGVLLDPKDPNLARQNPADYIEGFYSAVGEAVRAAGRRRGFRPDRIVGIGVDTTGSTPAAGRSPGYAAGHAAGVSPPVGRPGLALEGPHRARRGGRDHRQGRPGETRFPGQVRRDL